MPRNRKCIVERIIEALCDKLIVPPGKNVPAWNAVNACSTGEKLSLPMERRATHAGTISCRLGFPILLSPIDDLKRQKRKEQQEKRKPVAVQNFQKKLQEYSIPQLKTRYHSELNIWKPRVEEQKTPTAKSRLKSFEGTCATRGVSARGPGSNSSTARVKSASLGTDEPGIDSTRHRLEL
ncbi:hypothetical protein K0M31_001027 [Melipona bicolor]|uniref:Uncharacterized protein n=1 Tax=Melipona bicolor TaxID=60889 RepID=A0AA40GF01_9HYME|nr:hypothetical protein K0M31_001027 [Melipona bicolor]